MDLQQYFDHTVTYSRSKSNKYKYVDLHDEESHFRSGLKATSSCAKCLLKETLIIKHVLGPENTPLIFELPENRYKLWQAQQRCLSNSFLLSSCWRESFRLSQNSDPASAMLPSAWVWMLKIWLPQLEPTHHEAGHSAHRKW